MSERLLLGIIDDLRSDAASLRELFRAARSDDPKISELVDRLEPKLSDIEADLDSQARLCRYLSTIRENRPAYRELYTRVLFTLQQHRQWVYLLHVVYELASLREGAKEVKAYRRPLSLVDEYVDLLAGELDVPPSLLLIATPQSEYASLPILSEGVFIVMLPLTNLGKPWKWVLLSHELGHLYFQCHKERLLAVALPAIEKELGETMRNEERVEGYVHLWSEYWLQEIVSDIVAAGLCGPAYLKMLIAEATEPRPAQLRGGHPPLDARVVAQIEYMRTVGASSGLVSTMERIWSEFRGGIRETAPLPDYLSEDIIGHVSSLMADVIQEPFMVASWSDFERVMKGLPNTMGEDLRLVIPAMALGDFRAEL